MVSSRGVQLGADHLRIDEFHYRVAEPDIDFQDLLTGPEIALALVQLAADPGDEGLQKLVVGRLAVAHGWFQDGPSLDVSAARITGQGIGELLTGVFIWRAHDERDTYTYIVTPTFRARDVLKADPGLAKALIQVACPRPDDPHGELEERLAEAITRLGVAAGLGEVAQAGPGVADAGVVLEVKNVGGAGVAGAGREMGGPADAEPAAGSDSAEGLRPAEDRPAAEVAAEGARSAVDLDSAETADQVAEAGLPPRGGRERSDSERALSEELADLARKVGTAAVRPAVLSQGHDAAGTGGLLDGI